MYTKILLAVAITMFTRQLHKFLFEHAFAT